MINKKNEKKKSSNVGACPSAEASRKKARNLYS
jgi:hypothetical protein